MRTCLLLLPLVSLSGCCFARSAALEAMSSNNMHQMGIAMANYRAKNGGWPESLEEISPYLEGEVSELMTNPITGDDPGYEYVRPDMNIAPPKTVVLYQLRDGRRDTTLPVLFADGSVLKIAQD